MMQIIIDWFEVYKKLDLNMEIYLKLDSGENFNPSMILKDVYVEDDS